MTALRNNRQENEGISNDVHESNLEFMKKVYDNAMFLSHYLHFDAVQCNDGDQMKSISTIHEEVYQFVKK